MEMAEPVRWCAREPTLSEMLTDPIVQALMDADGVDPKELEAALRSVAAGAFSGKVVTGFPSENATNQ
jgi:hypothetical protein